MRSLIALALILCPAAAFAEALPAGFAPGPVWLSKTDLTAGDAVTAYAVVYDSSSQSVAGTLVLSIDGATQRSEDFTLSAGETKVESFPWTAVSGAHTIAIAAANLHDASTNASVTLADAAGGSVKVTVKEAPPSPVEAAQQAAKSAIASTTPALSAAFDAAESVRQSAEDYFAHKASSTAPSAGTVLGTSTSRTASTVPPSIAASVGSAFHMFWAALAYIAASPWWFYLLSLFALYLVYKIIRALFAERRRMRMK